MAPLFTVPAAHPIPFCQKMHKIATIFIIRADSFGQFYAFSHFHHPRRDLLPEAHVVFHDQHGRLESQDQFLDLHP